MIKKMIYFGLALCITSCNSPTGNNDSDTGILYERVNVPVSNETQMSLHKDDISSGKADTSRVFEEAVQDSMEAFLEAVKGMGSYKGLSAAVCAPGKGFWRAVTGESGTSKPLSVNTPFHALSMGKIFTSALVLKLCQQGMLDMSDTIDAWFPDMPKSEEITIFHLLTHTSGIQTYDVLKEFCALNYNSYSQEDLVDMAAAYPVEETPGTYFSYSNTGYVMLGLIIQEVLNKPVKQAFEQYLIEPAGLRQTRFCSEDETDMGPVRGYSEGMIRPEDQWLLTFGAGPLISTPTELVILYSYILSGDFINPDYAAIMTSKMNLWLSQPDTYYGKGVYVITGLPSGDYLGHGGSCAGFKTCMFYNTTYGVFTCVMSNSSDYEIEPAMFELTEKLIELVK